MSRWAGDSDATGPCWLPGWCPAVCPSPQQCSQPQTSPCHWLSPCFSLGWFWCPPCAALAGTRSVSQPAAPAHQGSLQGAPLLELVELPVGRALCSACTRLCSTGTIARGWLPGTPQAVRMTTGGSHCRAPCPASLLHSKVPHAGDLAQGHSQAPRQALSPGLPVPAVLLPCRVTAGGWRMPVHT